MQQFEMEEITRAALNQRSYDMAALHRERRAARELQGEPAAKAPEAEACPRWHFPRVPGFAHGFRLAHWHR